MDWQLIEQKLESLRRALARVRDKCPREAETLSKDYDAQDILTLNLTRAVQLCVDIGAHIIATTDAPAPDTMGGTFDLLHEAGVIDADLALRMKKAVGFRNIAVHNYDTVNWDIVHSIAMHRLQDFEAFALAVVRWLDLSDEQ